MTMDKDQILLLLANGLLGLTARGTKQIPTVNMAFEGTFMTAGATHPEARP